MTKEATVPILGKRLNEDGNPSVVLVTDIEWNRRVDSKVVIDVNNEKGEINYYYETREEEWNGDPPKLILATSSLRKSLMWFAELNGLAYPGNQDEMPLGLYAHLKEVNNGDGALKTGKPVMLGYYRGAEVWVESQEGETEGNDPVEQAENKARSLFGKYKDKNVIILAGDTVGVDRDGGQHGKPANLDDFDPNTYIDGWLSNGSVNINGLVALDCLTGKMQVSELKIETDTSGVDRSALVVDPHAGEGALPQQVVNWDIEFPNWRSDYDVYLKMMQHACQYAGSTPKPLLELARLLRLQPRQTFNFSHFDESNLIRDPETGLVTHAGGVPVDSSKRRWR